MKLAIIGVGRHARRNHLKILSTLKEKYNIRIPLIIDLEESKSIIDESFNKYNLEYGEYYSLNKSNIDDAKGIKKILKKSNVDSVLLSCDDEIHEFYLDILLELKLNILMEKPLFTSNYASISEESAKSLKKKFEKVESKYKKLFQKNNKIFSIIAQRRFHPAFQKIKTLLKEVELQTGCGVTSTEHYHSDGQWRLPEEIINESYHGYSRGIGKCSHSGYHFIDFLAQIIQNQESSHVPDSYTVNSTFSRPKDFLSQINSKTLKKIFPNYESNISDKQFLELTEDFGEIDASIDINFMRKGKLRTMSHLKLLHNGFSRRSWEESKDDLYKGNGRVRHEYHILNQGPFQTIIYESFQSAEVTNKKLQSSIKPGGELHFSVKVFRNSDLIKGKPYKEYFFDDFRIPYDDSKTIRGHQEFSKLKCWEDFLEAIEKNKTSISNYLDHKKSHELFSNIYLSAAKAFNKKNKEVLSKWE